MTIHDMTNKSMSRRTFLRISGLAIAAVGALLAGCRPTTTSGTAIESGGEFGTPRTLPTATAVVEQEAAVTTAVATSTPVMPKATATAAARATATPAVQQALGVACPRGLLNDPFPGHCRAYLDRNGNGYCDLSEPGSGNITPRTS